MEKQQGDDVSSDSRNLDEKEYPRMFKKCPRITLENHVAVDLLHLFWFGIHFEGGTYKMCWYGIPTNQPKRGSKEKGEILS